MSTLQHPQGMQINAPLLPGFQTVLTLPALELQHDAETLDAAYLPFYTHMSGTSMATPHVAGIVALLLEANPSLDPLEVREILSATADPMAGRARFEVGSGHVDAYEALQVAVTY